MSTDAAIEIDGLRKAYGAVEAARGISLEVRRGEIFAFLGPNGAGKTTTVEILEGFRRRSAAAVAGGRLAIWGVVGLVVAVRCFAWTPRHQVG